MRERGKTLYSGCCLTGVRRTQRSTSFGVCCRCPPPRVEIASDQPMSANAKQGPGRRVSFARTHTHCHTHTHTHAHAHAHARTHTRTHTHCRCRVARVRRWRAGCGSRPRPKAARRSPRSPPSTSRSLSCTTSARGRRKRPLAARRRLALGERFPSPRLGGTRTHTAQKELKKNTLQVDGKQGRFSLVTLEGKEGILL